MKSSTENGKDHRKNLRVSASPCEKKFGQGHGHGQGGGGGMNSPFPLVPAMLSTQRVPSLLLGVPALQSFRAERSEDPESRHFSGFRPKTCRNDEETPRNSVIPAIFKPESRLPRFGLDLRGTALPPPWRRNAPQLRHSPGEGWGEGKSAPHAPAPALTPETGEREAVRDPGPPTSSLSGGPMNLYGIPCKR